MKSAQAWRLGIKDAPIFPMPRQRGHLKKPTWIIVLVSLVSFFLICAYVYPPHNSAACYVFSSHGCKGFKSWLPPKPARELTDDEIASRIVIREMLKMPPAISLNPKIAFLFLTPGALPFERLWDKFFQGHEGRFSVYVHASKDKPVHFSRYFINREIRSDTVVWGKISMVDAERRLLANALKDPNNQHFVLLSDSCIPLRGFDYVYNYLMNTNVSFIDCFEDPGPHGTGRYIEYMLPEVEKKDFRKGAQDLSTSPAASFSFCTIAIYGGILIEIWMPPSHFTEPVLSCISLIKQPGMEGRNCYSDEHYLPTFFYMLDPGGIANWSVTHVDWSEMKWHPKSYRAQDVTFQLMRNITWDNNFSNDSLVDSSFAVDPLFSISGVASAVVKQVVLYRTRCSQDGFLLSARAAGRERRLAAVLAVTFHVLLVTSKTGAIIPLRNKLALRLIHRDSIALLPFNKPKLSFPDHAIQAINSSRTCPDNYSNTKISRSSVSLHDISVPVVPMEDGSIFLVNISIGEPPLPQLLAMDTGSQLIWVHCTHCEGCNNVFDPKLSSTYTQLSSNSPECDKFVHSHHDQESQCSYAIRYNDESTSRGVLAMEKFTFVTSTGGTVEVPDIVFGCALTKGNKRGREATSNLDQGEFHFNVTVDSGTTYTHLVQSAYEPLMTEVKNLVNGVLEPAKVRNGENQLCYLGDLERDLIGFPLVTLHLAEGSNVDLDVEAMFQRSTDGSAFCMAVVESRENIIGVRAQQFYNVGFDLDAKRVSFQRIDCELLED
ncbi:UNVERIFIED_CONTAM: Glycosyltransferase BC10 [Sesamum calycinum]|uniref:Glycosyltransferase BC10 n=1 Tax=Sesamum calycinum TaxID=2727403 RepID=A0AAW2NUN1_9LAMI